MAIADFNHEDFQQTQQSEQDQTLLVKFYVKAVRDTAQTTEQGRPVFKDKEYIDIRIPGSRDGAARPCTFRDKQRFPKHYAAFKQRVDQPTEGTPLAEWPVISRSLAEEMAFYNIKTVEQLANLNDSDAGKFMGAQSFKTKAKRWLAQARQEVTVEKLQDELASRDAMLDQMQQQLTALQERVDQE